MPDRWLNNLASARRKKGDGFNCSILFWRAGRQNGHKRPRRRSSSILPTLAMLAAIGFSAPFVAERFGLLESVASAQAETVIAGRATVVDGDTLAVEGSEARVRLYGIDAVEHRQTCDDVSGKRYLCGSRAADYLAQLIGRNGQVRCFEEDRDRYGRIVAECSTADNRTVLNAAMVKGGWAVEYRQYSDGRYDQEEAEAKANKRGLWAGTFVLPSSWRRGERLPDETSGRTETASAAPRAQPETADRGGNICRIKGNISGSGRIYHSPGQRDYEKTQINTAKGERWFCSAGEAEAAGWRAAKR